VKVTNDDLKLKPGMTANVTIIVASKDNVLKVANAALRFKPPSKDGNAPSRTTRGQNPSSSPPGMSAGASRGPGRMGAGGPGGKSTLANDGRNSASRTVWVLENKRPRAVPVITGISDGAFTEIISGNLKERQDVITESLSKTQKPTNGGPQSAPRFMR
jgi:HlyD family secretion protein